jgi:tripartite-type tricarboxylate transporter receptor subunit TctC
LLDAPTTIAPHVGSGKLKVLMVTGSHREAALPDVPTATESGFPGVQGEAWIGVVAPKGTSPEIVSRLNRELRLVLQSDGMQELLATYSFRSLDATPDEFAKLIRADHAKWGPIIREAGIRLD